MKVQLLLVLVAAACAAVLSETVNAPYSIIADRYIPLGEKIRKAEERMIQGRVIGGSPALLGELPYKIGTLTSYIGISGTGVCGGSLVTPNRVVSAASCWNDGVHQGLRVTAVAGSTTLFFGGSRIDSSVVALHPSFSISLLRYDISVIYLSTSFVLTATISTVALPVDEEVHQNFVGSIAIFSGYGMTADGDQMTQNASLNQVALTVISNSVCSVFFPFLIHDSHICTSMVRAGACNGDSGSPLTVLSKGRPLLIGVASFTSALGCEALQPSGFSRVTAVLDFLRQNFN